MDYSIISDDVLHGFLPFLCSNYELHAPIEQINRAVSWLGEATCRALRKWAVDNWLSPGQLSEGAAGRWRQGGDAVLP